MAYTLNIDGDEFVSNPAVPDISNAIAKIGRGDANFFIIVNNEYANVFMQTGYPQTLDGEWDLEYRDDTDTHYSRPVHVDLLVDVISQWMGLTPGWDPGPEWHPLEEDHGDPEHGPERHPLEEDDGDPAPGFDPAIETTWHAWVVPAEGDSLATIYVDDNGQPIPNAHLLSDVDLLTKLGGTVFKALPDGQALMLQPLLTEQSRNVIDDIVAHPDYEGYDWPKFAREHGIHADVPEHEAQFDFNPAIVRVYSRRVGRSLAKQARAIARAVVADPSFDPLDDELQERLVAKHASDAPARLLKVAQSAVLTRSGKLREKAEKKIAEQAKVYVASLTNPEVDRLALLTMSKRDEEIAAAHPHLSQARARTMQNAVTVLVSKGWRSRELRFATVSRALLATGKPKSDIAALLGISQTKVSTSMNDAPENIRLDADDHLRQLVAGLVDLDETLPSAAEVLTARKQVVDEAAAHIAAFDGDFGQLTAELIASWPRRTVDRFALLPYKDRELLLAELRPDLLPAVVEHLAGYVTGDVWRIDPEGRQSRYATAIRAIQAKGASRAAAARFLGIGASWAGNVVQRKPEDVALTSDDYLVALVDAYKK